MRFVAAVIGCGMIGGKYESIDSPNTYSHGKAYYINKSIKKILFFDSNPELSQNLALKFEGDSFSDLETLMNNGRPDCVSVCTPDTSHFQVMEYILRNPGSLNLIFVEKPVVMNPEELKLLKKLSIESGVTIIVNHSRRFDPAHQNLRELIQTDRLGGFIRGNIDYYGGWHHLGVHIVDILQYFFDKPFIPKKFEYVCESKYSNDPTLNVQAEIGGSSVEMAGMDESFYQIVDFNLKFEKGQIKINDFGNEILILLKKVNAEKENILEINKDLSCNGMVDPIVHAIGIITSFLEKKDFELIKLYGLDEAEKTMNTLWKGYRMYENQTQK